MADNEDKDAVEEEKSDKDETAGTAPEDESNGVGADTKQTPAEGSGDESAADEGSGDSTAEPSSDSSEESSGEADETVTDDVWAEALKESEGTGSADETVTDDVWAEAMKESGDAVDEPAAEAPPPEPAPRPPVDARPADFTELKGTGTGSLADMEMILDIPVTVSVELGRSVMLIKDILDLGQGSVVELEKMAGEPMEILVNSRLVARGEVVMVNEKFGVRLTDIISPKERVKRLA